MDEARLAGNIDHTVHSLKHQMRELKKTKNVQGGNQQGNPHTADAAVVASFRGEYYSVSSIRRPGLFFILGAVQFLKHIPSFRRDLQSGSSKDITPRTLPRRLSQLLYVERRISKSETKDIPAPPACLLDGRNRIILMTTFVRELGNPEYAALGFACHFSALPQRHISVAHIIFGTG
jgi:hypothetical protein